MRSGGMSLRQYAVTGRLAFWASFAGASKYFMDRDILQLLSQDGWIARHVQTSWGWVAGELPDAMTGPGKPLIQKNEPY